MTTKIFKNAAASDLALKSPFLVAAVSDFPGASIDSGNVLLDLSQYGDNASVVLARIGDELASISVSGTVATLDFTSVATLASTLELALKLDL